jgi:acetyl-CoA C-acetyltransferase
MNKDIVIVAAGRSAVGSFGGSLASLPASTLGAKIIAALVKQTGIDPASIDEVILGHVLTAGQGQNTARQA